MIQGHMKEVRTVFAEALATRLGRTAQEVREDGLRAGDFKVDEQVEITLPDGSSMSFRYAFVVLDAGQGIVGVFTEHCGYHCLPMLDLKVEELRTGKVVARHAW
jgi:hypothetical protein